MGGGVEDGQRGGDEGDERAKKKNKRVGMMMKGGEI